MINIDELFTQNSQQVIEEQHILQREIASKNKLLKELFSSKYQDLLNCGQILEGIGSYTHKIIQVSNQTLEQLAMISEQGFIDQPKDQTKQIAKSSLYLIKKIKQQAQQNPFIAYICSKILLNQLQGDPNYLYLSTLHHKLSNEICHNNYTASFAIFHDREDQFIEQIIGYGSQSCQKFRQIQQLFVDENNNQYQQYANILQNINHITLQQVQSILIDDQQLRFHFQQIESNQFKSIIDKKSWINNQIIDKIIHTLTENNQFNKKMYIEIYNNQDLISQQHMSKIIQVYLDSMKDLIANSFKNAINYINSLDKESLYDQSLDEWNIIISQIVIQESEEEIFHYDKCQVIVNEWLSQLNNQLANKANEEFDDFMIILLLQSLIYLWNQKYPQIQLKQLNLTTQWNLKTIDKLINTKLQNKQIEFTTVIKIIQQMLSHLDIPFSLEHRNIGSVIHPEKCQEYYQKIFSQGGFNNKSLKRVYINNNQKNLPTFDFDVVLTNFLIYAPTKQNSQQFGQWGVTTATKQKPNEKTEPSGIKSRFGFSWGKQ